MKHIRNFSIIAHIDHGKSTLADRILELTQAVSTREMREQVLDDMELERERGITIKARAVTIQFTADDKEKYLFNFIDTPGHVDFSYEVSRSLAACEGALLVVDASQGVEAQTVANAYQAIDNDLEIVPVINKIDLASARPDYVKQQIEEIVGVSAEDALSISAKRGDGVREVLQRIVDRIPAPGGDPHAPFKAMLFDSWYDSYRGVVMLVRILDGTITSGNIIKMLSSRSEYELTELGIFTPKMTRTKTLSAGEVGYLIAGIKNIQDTKIGDTIVNAKHPNVKPFPGFKQVKPMVFSGLYPIDPADYEDLRSAMEKLQLNDSSFQYEPETSMALGFGFRCGYLGLLHMEIIQQRLEREFNLELITTAPEVGYQIKYKDGTEKIVDNPAKWPEANEILDVAEPIIEAMILSESEFIGPILKLLEDRRGVQQEMKYLSVGKVLFRYDLPLNEVVIDFYDKLKSVSRGYASFDYNFKKFETSPLVKLDVLVNGQVVDALSLITHRSNAPSKGRELALKMKRVIPRQLYEVVIQCAIGNKVIARETIKPMRKNVTAKCYGGDITRKRKLLEKQKEGKKRMKKLGKIEIPQEAFHTILRKD
ncbi:MAG: elongation factor 4 [Acidobacteria bacterium]|nr:elongation factor 4 [Acidobacteriota bacterium]